MRKIRKYGENILRKRAEEVKNIDDKIRKLIKSMKETLVSVKGIGLAANQVGVLKRIFIAYDKERENLITVINPEIVDKKEIEMDLEGCLSFPEIYFSISRNKIVTVKGINEDGKEIIIDGKDLLARCFQHEIDHLNGILIIDYATEEEKKYYKEKLRKLTTNS
ncbi:MAG: peptide deformylase [Candidatus Omnitrophica bacterium]|nr:peptide deformylase [Candidatus Omnitrophota bacterium]MCM8801705.1 peptide deformylase [Candidatus Omnitrophota bacterium]